MSHRKEIRVFVSSPGDCDAERDAVLRVLDEMNRTVGERERVFFQAVRWEDLSPGLGKNPQSVIDDQLGDYNVLVGIMWMRFGTPIPGGAGSGTEHEVQQAIQSWTRIGQPRVMFYFKNDPPMDLSSIDPVQLAQVQDFKKQLQAQALIQTFQGTYDFESKLRVHLNKLVNFFDKLSPLDDASSTLTQDLPKSVQVRIGKVASDDITRRIGGIQRLLDDVYQKAQTYRIWLLKQIEVIAEGGKANLANEPPPTPKRTMEILDEEIGQLNKLIWKETRQPAHLFEPYSDFGPRYHNDYDAPPSLFGGKTVESLKHDYTGILVWVDQSRAYLAYLMGTLDTQDT